jgi:polyhydroxybutyrate depolymerase
MKKIFLILISINISLIHADMERVNMLFDNEERHYLVYVPDKQRDQIDKIVIGLHGYTGSATGFEMETTGGFNTSADKYNFIAIYPQGSFFYEQKLEKGKITSEYVSSWNDLTGSKTKTPFGETCAEDAVVYPKYPNCIGTDAGRCAWTSCGNDMGFIKKIIDDVKTRFNLKKIYVVGMSNGGKMAHAIACEFSKDIVGVINVVGSPQNGLACEPKTPINYIIYAGANDQVVPPFNVVSFDRYFYTPVTTLINKWTNSFNCKKKEFITNIEFDSINEQIYSGCDGGVRIVSLLNTEQGHSWPGTKEYAGFCRTKYQSEIDLDPCLNSVNEWGNDFLLQRLFNL